MAKVNTVAIEAHLIIELVTKVTKGGWQPGWGYQLGGTFVTVTKKLDKMIMNIYDINCCTKLVLVSYHFHFIFDVAML